jgi:NADPH:quinone reductase
MQAWRVHRNGEPSEVMRLEEVERPTPGEGQLLLRVRAANINFPDALLCRGQYQIRPPLPFTPGVEICGETEDGRRVIANPVLPNGGLADYVVADAAAVLPAPDALDDAEAAALHIGYQTGWFGLHRRAHLQEGETLLVHAAAGGVGSFAVQIARHLGARVLGTASEANHDYLRSLGAEPVRYGDGLADRVRLLAADGVTAALDLVGGDALAVSGELLAPAGRLASIVDPGVADAGGRYVFVRPDPADLAALTDLAEQGVLGIELAQVFPLAETAEAQQLSAEGHVRGKIAITMQ